MVNSAEMFQSILKYSNIYKVYYVDDYLSSDFDLEKVMAITEGILQVSGEGRIVESLRELIDLRKVPPSEITNTLRQFCEGMNPKVHHELTQNILGLSDAQYLIQSKQTSRIVGLFPDSIAEEVHPTKWDEKKASIKSDSEKGKVLLLLDQDLKNATGFESRTGVELIRELKKETYFDKLTCVLISNDIEETKDELDFRSKIIKAGTGLSDSDFFPLSKRRIDNEDHFYDGIKKSLLNSHCELIKEESSKIIKEAYGKTLARIKEINTYDFDHTIFQSSYEEGVWEAETLFRISGIIFDEEIKKEIIDKQFQKNVNVSIRESKRLSDIRFKIDSNLGEPYTERYKLRHTEIYETGDVINRMHKPIDNGDIFELYDGTEEARGLYILVGQECDLAVRNPSGERESKLGFLYRIKEFKIEEFYEMMVSHYAENKRDYFDSKFKLDYLIYGTNNIGIVSFKNPLMIDLRVLELVVFHENGEAMLDLKNPIDTSVLSFAWENRYRKAVEFLNLKSGWAIKGYHTLKKLKESNDESVVNHLTNINRLKLSPFRPDIGSDRTLNNNVYKFGLRRVLNLRRPGSAILLDILTKYQSRHATPHDFAFLS